MNNGWLLAILLAILGIGGTIGGQVAGSLTAGRNARLLEEERAKQQNRTRYNADRARAYARFLAYTHKFVREHRACLIFQRNDFSPSKEELDTLRIIYYEVRILATHPVKEAADKIYELVKKAWKTEDTQSLASIEKELGNGAAREFEEKVQIELDIDNSGSQGQK